MGRDFAEDVTGRMRIRLTAGGPEFSVSRGIVKVETGGNLEGVMQSPFRGWNG